MVSSGEKQNHENTCFKQPACLVDRLFFLLRFASSNFSCFYPKGSPFRVLEEGEDLWGRARIDNFVVRTSVAKNVALPIIYIFFWSVPGKVLSSPLLCVVPCSSSFGWCVPSTFGVVVMLLPLPKGNLIKSLT